MKHVDVAIIGAGMAGASLAAAIGVEARVAILEAEEVAGYHATGRSAAFWSETYGGPAVQPLTSASGPMLAEREVLAKRGALTIARSGSESALHAAQAAFEGSGVDLALVDRPALRKAIPGLLGGWDQGLLEPSTKDIDVAALHAAYLAEARAAGAEVLQNAAVTALQRGSGGWQIETRRGDVLTAQTVICAAGAWASDIARMAGAQPIDVTPYRRTVLQLEVDPPAPGAMPLILDADQSFYFKPSAGGRIWLSPHDETPVPAGDVVPEEIDIAQAIDRLEQVVNWRVVRVERKWAGLRSFAPDRAPVYGFDAKAPGFFWFAGQGGFGIQTAPAAALIGAALLLDQPLPDPVRAIDIDRYSPARFLNA